VGRADVGPWADAHGALNNAAKKDPYGIDVLFLYMANMAWNSSMNVPGTLEALTAKDDNGDYVIPKIIYSDAYYSETVPYADLILPDTTYLERWDCISLLDRPISEPDMVADAIRQPVVEPDRDVRGFQDVLIDLGARLGLPGFVKADGSPAYPGGYPDYMVNHERKPGIGPLSGWRGEDGTETCVGAPNPDQLKRYIENGAFHVQEIAPEHAYFKHANRGYLDWGIEKGIRLSPEPTIFQLYCEPLQRFRLAAQGHGDRQPPDRARERIETYFDPLPFWYPPFEGEMVDGAEFPLHAITQRPMHMYHSWGSQNAWLRQITAENRLYIHRDLGARIGVGDEDWVWIASHLGRVKCQVRLMDGVNPHTVWTWNAIGKRKGAWGLDKDAPEATRGFLLNHLISELLPEGAVATAIPTPTRSRGRRRGSTCACPSRRPMARGRRSRGSRRWAGAVCPRRRRNSPMASRRWNAHDQPARRDAEEARPRHRPRHLRRLPGLRDLLQGMEHRRLFRAAQRSRPLWRGPLGRVPQRVSTATRWRSAGAVARCISRAPACIARSPTASPSARRAPATSAPRTGSSWSIPTPASAASCVPGPALTARGNTTTMTA
jgi:hypothetical protein